MYYVGETEDKKVYLGESESLLLLGSAGSGKTNMTSVLLDQVGEDSRVAVFGHDGEYKYKNVMDSREYVRYYFGTDEVLNGLGKIKELIKRVKSGLMSIDESFYVVVDDLGLLMTKMLENHLITEFRELIEYVITEGKSVGIVFWVMTYRPVPFDLPVWLRREVGNVIMFENYAGDFSELGFDITDYRFPKKKGEGLFKLHGDRGFIKTYEIEKYREKIPFRKRVASTV